jgi:hypothetical protein
MAREGERKEMPVTMREGKGILSIRKALFSGPDFFPARITGCPLPPEVITILYLRRQSCLK